MSKLNKIRFNETQTYWHYKYSIYLTREYRLYLETTNPTFNRYTTNSPFPLYIRVSRWNSQTNEWFDRDRNIENSKFDRQSSPNRSHGERHYHQRDQERFPFFSFFSKVGILYLGIVRQQYSDSAQFAFQQKLLLSVAFCFNQVASAALQFVSQASESFL